MHETTLMRVPVWGPHVRPLRFVDSFRKKLLVRFMQTFFDAWFWMVCRTESDDCSEDEEWLTFLRDLAYADYEAYSQCQRALELAEAKAYAQENATGAPDDAHATAAATGAAYESSAAAASSGASADDHATALRLYGKSPRRNLSIYFDGSIGFEIHVGSCMGPGE